MQEGPKKVLIVDDEEILTWIMSKTLAKDRKRYEVLVANDCSKALQIMDEVPIDLVITDIRMPGMSGLDMIEEVRQRHPDTKVIVMTAYGSPEIQKEAINRGCLYYLEKPFKIEELRSLILDAIKVSKKGFVGRVADLQLTDIIQLNCLARMKTALSVSKEDMEGIIYFEDGEIVHAQCGSKTGEAALFEILKWEGGDFSTLSGAEASTRTINRPWQELLIEGMRQKDEGAGGEGGGPEAVNLRETEDEEEDYEEDDFGAPEIDYETGQPKVAQGSKDSLDSTASQETPLETISVAETIPKEVIRDPFKERPRSTKEKAKLIQKLLADWQKESEEIQGAAVVTTDGIALGAHLSKSRLTQEQFSALTGQIFKVGRKASRATGRGELEEMYIKGAVGTLYLYLIESKAVLGVIASADANMGVVHLESREKCRRIANILGLS